MRKLCYLVAASIDGFIAALDGSIDLFPMDEEYVGMLASRYPETLPTHVRAMLGAEVENRVFDTAVMGRTTYEQGVKAGLTNPYAHLRTYVVSSSLTETADEAVQLISSDVLERVAELKEQPGLSIWLCGGPQLAATLYPVLDELIVKVNPIVLGSGIPLFGADVTPGPLRLKESSTVAAGVTVQHYEVLH
ncbi:dihydrofolate reductase family protein [Tenggerimyces flavus]|uniref:Dihydrofolate reductase family protein n=1 Tax=Tenggerimyces flavus TaxID=1708749 RepID=A0ABV7Y7T0_9ACTN|nr:dihydrofolate reductase family protein [Tenggerimyces flavus]MBM7788241.1 dihydrofolate reductase [Tenggerimyces flavus]